MVEVARRLRQVENFRGYIHLKTIPDAHPDLLARAGRHADRLSVHGEAFWAMCQNPLRILPPSP